ncbi:MAG: ornithine cyclodeaminase family protein [Treponema sp.]|nr:ornithine cyclodeaminase family protein [Treponema sp.]
MKFFDSTQVEALLDMEGCIKLMKETLIDLTEGRATQILRTVIPLGGGNLLGLMPSSISSKNLAGTKVITIFPGNFEKKLPSHQGVVLYFETLTGALKAVLDGESITAIRTAAVSAVATDLLARKNSEVLAIIGAGVQARTHLNALKRVRNLKKVLVWDINPDSAKNYAKEMGDKYSLPITVCDTSSEAVKDADIICTVTGAIKPVLFGKDLKKGVHINAVGACRPDARELDTDCIAMGKMYADRMESVLNEAGDFIIPYNEGLIGKEKIVGELGEALLGKIAGRETESDITIFEALGLAVYDLAAADYIYARKI